MKVHYYEPPSKQLVSWAMGLKARREWLKYPAAVALVLVWAIAMPLAWAAIKAGDLGHRLAGWCGFESRDW